MAAARAAERADRGRIAVPLPGCRFEPADTVVGILHRGRVRGFRRTRQVDSDHEKAACGQLFVHLTVGGAILIVPSTAVQI